MGLEKSMRSNESYAVNVSMQRKCGSENVLFGVGQVSDEGVVWKLKGGEVDGERGLKNKFYPKHFQFHVQNRFRLIKQNVCRSCGNDKDAFRLGRFRWRNR